MTGCLKQGFGTLRRGHWGFGGATELMGTIGEVFGV
jgi:hypothetical protein